MSNFFKISCISGFWLIISGTIFTLYMSNHAPIPVPWNQPNHLSIIISAAIFLELCGSLGKLFYNQLTKNNLQTNALRTTGTIISVKQTGNHINTPPEIELTIKYSIEGKNMIGTTRQILPISNIPSLIAEPDISIKYSSKNPFLFSLDHIETH